MAYFPMYVNLTDRRCLLVGGGEIALRKLQILLDFDAYIIVIAKSLCPEIRILSEQHRGRLEVHERAFEAKDCEDIEMAIAATGDDKVNSAISELCRSRRIPVNVVDDKKKCSFIFGSYVKERNLVASVSSAGESPLITQKIAGEIKKILTPRMGDMSRFLGELRPIIKQEIYAGDRLYSIESQGLDPSKISAAIYRQIYGRCMQRGEDISLDEVMDIIKEHIQ